MDEIIFQKLLILRTNRIGPAKYNELLSQFKVPAAANEFLNHSDDHIDSVKREIDHAARAGIIYIDNESEYYPENLKAVRGHPPVISVRGNPETLKRPAVAIVGTRHATGAGMRFVKDMAREFATNGYTVVSGMAMGTDTAAHTGALASAGNHNTIAVLAGGADYIWPLENEKLYSEIIERGCVISEMPFGTKPIANNFIQRNRWIAGLGEKLILGEADEKSGSMATAGFAIEYNRPIYAIPSHPSDLRSQGPNRLIKNGDAILCMGAEDFFEIKKSNNKKSEIRNYKSEIMDRIGNIPIAESVLAELVKKTVADVRRELVMLELAGLVRKTDGGYVKV